MVDKQYVLDQVTKHFERCPLCDASTGFKISGLITKSIQCNSCFGKWNYFEQYGKNVALLKYVVPSRNEEFGWLLGVSRDFQFWATLDNLKKIDWNKTSKEIPNQIADTLIMNKNERILANWIGNDFDGLGILLLTNQRLIWLRRQIDGTHYLDHTINLEHVRQILESFKDGEMENIEVLDDLGSRAYAKTVQRMTSYPAAKLVIQTAIDQRKEEIELEKKQERMHVLIDYSFLTDYMKKGGIVLQVLKCPNCNGQVKLPKSGAETVCEHCGNTIYAQDVFKKIKDLIG